MSGDITCPDGVELCDLAELSEQWLFEELTVDIASPGPDGIVDFADFSVFASQWGIANGIDELFEFTEQWLKIGLPVCYAAEWWNTDQEPSPDGDGRVDAADFAAMANDWLEGF